MLPIYDYSTRRRIIRAISIYTLLLLSNGSAATTTYVLADGVYLPSTYATNKLNPEFVEGSLTIIDATNKKSTVLSSIPVPNSVTGSPDSLTIDQGQKRAYVTAMFAPRNEGTQHVKQLSKGNFLTTIDITNKRQPKLLEKIVINTRPISVKINNDNLLVTSDEKNKELVIIQLLEDGKAESFQTFSLEALGINTRPDVIGSGLITHFADWHPSGDVIAVNLFTSNRVVFFQVHREGNKISLEQWGNGVETGPDPYSGRFSPDGKYYFTSNWGRNFQGKTLEERLPGNKGSISVIRLGDITSPHDKTTHTEIARVESDTNPEGIAISPDGKLLATANMRGTFFDNKSPLYNRFGTVSLFRFDDEQLIKIADFPFEGVLPEGLSFDRTGKTLSASIYQYQNKDSGGVLVWDIEDNGDSVLLRASRRTIKTPTGTHQVIVY